MGRNMKNRRSPYNLGLMAALILVILLESMFLPSTSMIFPVIRKGAIYALVAVSMNLTNGFTGLFSLGQAGFMLIGAYTYAIFTIPDADRASVYMYFNGGAIHANLPVIVALILAGPRCRRLCLSHRSAGAAPQTDYPRDCDARLLPRSSARSSSGTRSGRSRTPPTCSANSRPSSRSSLAGGRPSSPAFNEA